QYSRSLTNYRDQKAAHIRELNRAHEEGGEYNAARKDLDQAVDAAWRKFGDMSSEEIERLDPEQRQEALRLGEQYRVSEEALRQQLQPAEQPQPTEQERQAHEQAQHEARVQEEQGRLAYEHARTQLTQGFQQATNERQQADTVRAQIWQAALVKF